MTVTSSDKKSKKVYTVTVNRLSKETSGDIIKNNSSISVDDEVYVNGSDEDENEDNAEESFIAQNNKIALQNSSAPLVVKENAFNFIVFIICSVLFITFSFIILKRKKN